MRELIHLHPLPFPPALSPGKPSSYHPLYPLQTPCALLPLLHPPFILPSLWPPLLAFSLFGSHIPPAPLAPSCWCDFNPPVSACSYVLPYSYSRAARPSSLFSWFSCQCNVLCVRPSLLRSLLPWNETAERTLVEVRLEDCRVVCLRARNKSVVSNDATAESIHD